MKTVTMTKSALIQHQSVSAQDTCANIIVDSLVVSPKFMVNGLNSGEYRLRT